MRRMVQGVLVCLVAMGGAASVGLGPSGSLAFAAQPKAESTSQFLSRANGICRIAARDVLKAGHAGKNASLHRLLAAIRGTARAYAWESRAFKKLRAPGWAIRDGYKNLGLFYGYAGDELMDEATEDSLGNSAQAQIDLDDSEQDTQDATNEAIRLGMTC